MRRAAGIGGPARLLAWAATVALGACSAPPPGLPATATARPLPELPLPGGVTLIGLGGTDLEDLLGRPALLRREPPAEFWRYDLGACQLDLFLYHDPTGGGARVLYLDMRPSGRSSPSQAEACEAAERRVGDGTRPTPDLGVSRPSAPT